MTYQNHPQPRYFGRVAFFSFFVWRWQPSAARPCRLGRRLPAWLTPGEARILAAATGWPVLLGRAVVAMAALAAASTASRPELRRPPRVLFCHSGRTADPLYRRASNGKRLLVSISGDQITLATHCRRCATISEPQALNFPTWTRSWLIISPAGGRHGRYRRRHAGRPAQSQLVEQVASFRAFDDPERNVLVLFKLHPLPGGQRRDPRSKTCRFLSPETRSDSIQ